MATDEVATCETRFPVDPERVAYWYFRLNGFLTTVNFLVHSDAGTGQRTEADVLGVRFPYREELSSNPMRDADRFIGKGKPYIVIAEVAGDRCKLNGPWTKPGDQNIQRVLAAIGAIPRAGWDLAAEALYSHGVYEDEHVYFTLCCLGKRENSKWLKKFPVVPQILWSEVAHFFCQRFKAYRDQKRANQQWDSLGRWLYALAFSSDGEDAFTQAVLDAIALFESSKARKK